MSAILSSFLNSLATRAGKIITGALTLGAVTAATGGGELPIAIARLISPRPAPGPTMDELARTKETERLIALLQEQNPKSSIESILGSIDPRLIALLLGGGAGTAGLLAVQALRRRRARRRRPTARVWRKARRQPRRRAKRRRR